VLLHVLGCCGAKAAAGRACSGYLLELDGRRVWLDAGGGTLSELLRHTSLDELDAIAISHLHADHWTDLPLAVHTLKQGEVERPVPVYGPPGFVDRVGVPIRDQLGSRDSVVEAHELADGLEVALGGVTMTARAVEHGDLECFGFRVEGGETFAYSADTGPCDALGELAAGAGLFLCEAGAASVESDTHLTPEQAGETAAAAGVGTLVVTHLRADDDPLEVEERARSRFAGELVVARDGLEVRPRATARER
jgi:ribonuclease BN (tRNA processing enzyme)